MLFVTLYAASGLVALSLVWTLPQVDNTRRVLIAAAAIGAALRLLFLASTPIYEDDFYRYMWDGAVTAHGIDPYKYPPADFVPEDDALSAILPPAPDDTSPEQRTLSLLAEQSGRVIERVNYPYIKTQYPLVAQGAFALSYLLQPWSLEAWRLLCFLCELGALALLIKTLQHLGRSPLWCLLYWLNPVAIFEIANRAHMEALLLPALAGTLYFLSARRPLLATAALSTAVGIKFWPALLFPVLFRGYLHNSKVLAGMAGVAAVMCLAFLLPQLPHGVETNSGLVTYSQSWQTNSFLFTQTENLLAAFGVADADLATRWLVALLISAAALALAIPKLTGPLDAAARMLAVTTVLFLLSPTQYPWYFLWMLPFLVIVPVWPLLVLPVTLPLYFLRYGFAERGETSFFENVVVPIEFGPILLLLGVWLWQHRRQIRMRLYVP